MSKQISSKFFQRETSSVAFDLIGKVFRRRVGDELLSCRIVETEAYLPSDDDACHAAKKKTPKNEVMFEEAGIAYVYAIHGKFCVNFVTESSGLGCAVLLRAAEPLTGFERMKSNRNTNAIQNLLSGPSKICQALEIDKTFNGSNLVEESGLWICDDGFSVPIDAVKVTPRIGVTSAKDKPLRFVLKQSEFASGPKYLR